MILWHLHVQYLMDAIWHFVNCFGLKCLKWFAVSMRGKNHKPNNLKKEAEGALHFNQKLLASFHSDEFINCEIIFTNLLNHRNPFNKWQMIVYAFVSGHVICINLILLIDISRILTESGTHFMHISVHL